MLPVAPGLIPKHHMATKGEPLVTSLPGLSSSPPQHPLPQPNRMVRVAGTSLPRPFNYTNTPNTEKWMLSTKHSAGTKLRNSVFGQWKVLQPIKVETPVRDIFETLATRWASEGRPGPHFFGVLPANRCFFPILRTSFLFQPCKMLQHFLAPGLASSLNYRNPTTWTHRAAT